MDGKGEGSGGGDAWVWIEATSRLFVRSFYGFFFLLLVLKSRR